MLKNVIEADLKVAMKEKNAVKLAALRAIKGEILVAEKSGKYQEITDPVVVTILQKMVKTRKESISIYYDGGRPELAEEEKAQLAIIEDYLPAQLSEDEISNIVAELITSVGATSIKDMGKVMKLAKEDSRLAGKADAAIISKVVKSKLT